MIRQRLACNVYVVSGYLMLMKPLALITSMYGRDLMHVSMSSKPRDCGRIW